MAHEVTASGPAPLRASAADKRRRGMRHSAACVWGTRQGRGCGEQGDGCCGPAEAASCNTTNGWPTTRGSTSLPPPPLPFQRCSPPAHWHPAGKTAPVHPPLAAPAPPGSHPAARGRRRQGAGDLLVAGVAGAQWQASCRSQGHKGRCVTARRACFSCCRAGLRCFLSTMQAQPHNGSLRFPTTSIRTWSQKMAKRSSNPSDASEQRTNMSHICAGASGQHGAVGLLGMAAAHATGRAASSQQSRAGCWVVG